MIILDTSQFVIGSVMSSLKINKDVIDEGLIRHIFLNSIRENRIKFYQEYGELVFAVDSGNPWRKDIFEHYKANRKKARAASDIDWNDVYRVIDKIIDEVRTTFPYRVVKVPRAEGDDIIATLCIEYRDEAKLILSSDKDFIQLQKYPHVFQFDAMRKRWLKDKSPDKFLREHIIRGDSSDGVPNFLSGDRCLVDGVKQKSIMTEKVNGWLKMSEDEFYRNLTEDQKSHWHRNKSMIDLTQIPVDIREAILQEYDKPVVGHRSKILTYFIRNRMKLMTNCLSDF